MKRKDIHFVKEKATWHCLKKDTVVHKNPELWLYKSIGHGETWQEAWYRARVYENSKFLARTRL